MTIYCNINKKIFRQKPNVHLQGSGCPICAKEKHKLSHTKTESTFLREAITKHGYTGIAKCKIFVYRELIKYGKNRVNYKIRFRNNKFTVE